MATGLCGTCGGSTPGCGCYVTAGSGITITGDGSSGSPFVVTNEPVAGDGIAVSGSTISAKNRRQLANPVRNASFAVWQRGTSLAVTGSTGFYADGWRAFRNGGVAGMTVSRQVSGDSQGSGYCCRVSRDSGNSAVDSLYMQQSIPTVDSIRFQNRQVTLSFRARKGANYSAASSYLYLQSYTGTGTDQSLGAGFTGSATLQSTAFALTTSWQTFTVTVAVASNATEIGLQPVWTPVGTAGAADYAEIKDIRIDEGAYAQEHVPLPYALDLAECQRFFCRQGGVGNNDFHGNAYVATATVASLGVQFPVTMRAIPALTVSAVGGLVANDGTASPVSTAIALSGAVNNTPSRVLVNVTCGAGGLTVGRGCVVYTGGTAANGILDFSAEI